MKYTPDQYQHILNQYCTEQNITKGFLVNEPIYNFDLLNDNIEEQNIILILSNLMMQLCSKSKNYANLLQKRNNFRQFYDWCRNQNPPLITWQPFDSQLLSPKILLHKMAQNIELRVFDDEGIEELCSRFTLNRPLYEMLVRIFYEGVSSVYDLFDITMSDIRFEENRIFTNGRWRSFSEKTMLAIREYSKMTEFVIRPEHKSEYTLPMTVCEDRLIKKIMKRKDSSADFNRSNMNSYFSNLFKRISETAGCSVNAEILFKSGFLNYVYQCCNGNRELFAELFIGVVEVRSNGQIGRKLEAYAREYGIKKANANIRMDYALYVLKSHYLNK